ncbi:hypothetical protein EVJ58_g6151 [Rhodofomes roseus]|uniref:Reverse transcriptase domain-containing protein n=1 Tax=Rhodofomes roseus TaxID=34475 RepID=A0A4Y9YD92_9APHY|nr:hypothetical protein EVJ58_g6151 [Rhodofomes roseus]
MKASCGFQDLTVSDWYAVNHEKLDKLKWTEFIAALRKCFLPRNWVATTEVKLLNCHQREEQTFDDWVDQVEKINVLLCSSTSAFSDDRLRSHLTANAVVDLRDFVAKPTTIAVTDYEDWKAMMSTRDITRVRDRLRMLHLINAHAASRSSKVSSSGVSSMPTAAGSGGKKHPLVLTDEEKELLKKFGGCFKCRRFFVKCRTGSCKTGPPDGSTYHALTMADVDAARSRRDKENKSSTVAAVEDIVTDMDSSSSVVAAVADLAASVAGASVDDGSGSDTDNFQYVAPLSVPHLSFTAIIHSPSEVASPLPLLIDSGSPTVLIRDDLVSQLKLRRRKLPHPYPMGNAWGEGRKSCNDYVHLKVSSPDFAWSSVVCQAIIVPSLFAPVILGRPFLKANKLLVDHASDAVTVANTGFDIRNHPTPAAADHSHAALCASQRRVLDELRERTRDKLEATEANILPRVPAVLAIREHLESVAQHEQLLCENASMKREFADLFPSSLPAVERLPTDVYHCFELKQPDIVIHRRQYDCPKQYREVWRKMLQDHLDAGHLHPSNSPYVSPCFLIPKSDPTAEPRWVNDYRLLNNNTVPDSHPLPKIADILSDCAKGKVWGKTDMINAFFQTRVHPNHVKYSAITTPWGLYEWTVMPQCCRNAPATHQRRRFSALRKYIGKFCHVYLDDIIIWSDSVEQH